eukprot:SAG22_NODE_16340_length_327_cov_0.890351_1_plen_50_part_10
MFAHLDLLLKHTNYHPGLTQGEKFLNDRSAQLGTFLKATCRSSANSGSYL